MSFVVYDVETTGLNKRFDQIVQFAAVLTDTDLNVKDRIELGCRLMPHVIPSPKAMQVTGLRIEQLLDASLASHYEMVAEVRRILESWCPALFLGFNSLSFDEEFLRQAFYLCIYNPYLTNTPGNARADVLNLCRMTAALRPDVLRPATDEGGRKVFRLKLLAEANGIAAPTSHRAMADVSTTLALCQLIKNSAPEIWSQFLRFSQKSSVESFVTDEDAFLVSETIGNHHRTRLVTRIGKHTQQPARHYCLDVSSDLDALRQMSDGDLVNLCRSPARPIVTIRTNARTHVMGAIRSRPRAPRTIRRRSQSHGSCRAPTEGQRFPGTASKCGAVRGTGLSAFSASRRTDLWASVSATGRRKLDARVSCGFLGATCRPGGTIR